MKSGCFYFINDQYFVDFECKELPLNKSTKEENLHDRPCFYAIKGSEENIYWMIPISSKIEKFKRLYNDKIKKYGKCDTIIFGIVKDCNAAFLIQNMFPVTQEYIREEYRDLKTKKSVRIDFKIEQEIKKKACRVLSLERKGVKLLFANSLEIESKLIKMELKKNNKETEDTNDEKNKKEELVINALKSKN